MQKIKSIIIDDEKLARDLLKSYLKEIDYVEVLAECENGFEGVKAIHDLQPDFIFLDIQMPKIDGFEMLELLEEKPHIIFTTAYDQYAVKAFEHHAADYLLKPFSAGRLKEAVKTVYDRIVDNADNKVAIEKVAEEVKKPDEKLARVVVKKGAQIHVIPVETIIYFEAQDDYVMIYTNKQRFLKQKTMKFFESNLDGTQFVRIHRSYILNIKQIEKLELYDKESYVVILKDGNKLKTSKSGYKNLKEVLKF